jgi:hypothetical protein
MIISLSRTNIKNKKPTRLDRRYARSAHTVPPEWRIEPNDLSVTIGRTAVIDCQADGFPAARVEWRLSQGKHAARTHSDAHSDHSIRPASWPARVSGTRYRPAARGGLAVFLIRQAIYNAIMSAGRLRAMKWRATTFSISRRPAGRPAGRRSAQAIGQLLWPAISDKLKLLMTPL